MGAQIYGFNFQAAQMLVAQVSGAQLSYHHLANVLKHSTIRLVFYSFVSFSSVLFSVDTWHIVFSEQ
jgi:hypothetical protein